MMEENGFSNWLNEALGRELPKDVQDEISKNMVMKRKTLSFPLIEKMGLKLIDVVEIAEAFRYKHVIPKYYISSFDLETALEKATVVYGQLEGLRLWSTFKENYDTHKALLINVEELPKEPLKHEFIGCTYDDVKLGGVYLPLGDAWKSKKVRVKIEEIRE
ncbi:MAG: hypothetical protein ACXVB1_09000 [Pseudobdellovibrionaceae bacterium]